jgi:hypothetical protein
MAGPPPVVVKEEMLAAGPLARLPGTLGDEAVALP